VDGGTLQLSSLRGKVVLLDFWATWCAPCRRAIPHLNKLHSTYGEDGFEIVGISVDQPRGTVAALDLVRAFMARTTMKYPNVMGSLSVVTAYGGIRSIPTAFLIDREGRIRHRYVGYQPPHVLDRDVKAVLAEGVDGTASI
jgi:thiol-disulfide isomerase/thioredoxin